MALATVRLDKIAQGENQEPQKGVTPTALVADAGSIPTLSTSFQRVSDAFVLGNNPSLGGNIVWTYGSGTILTVRFKVSMDDGASDPYKWAPSVGSPSSGVSAVDAAELTFAKATWDRGATYADCPFELLLSRWRYVQVWAKSNNASGSCSGYVCAGTRG